MNDTIKAGDRLCQAAVEALDLLEQQRNRTIHAQAVMASLRHATIEWRTRTARRPGDPAGQAARS